MDKLFLFRFAGKNVYLPKLLGSFIVFASVLFFFQSSALMFESWENIKQVNYCLHEAVSGAEIQQCQSMAKNAFGFFVRPNQSVLSNKQFAIALISPIASMFSWIAVLIVGVMVYNLDKAVIPVKESVLHKGKKKRTS